MHLDLIKKTTLASLMFGTFSISALANPVPDRLEQPLSNVVTRLPVLDMPFAMAGGQRALDALTQLGKLNEVAASYNMKPEQLMQLLKNDPSAKIDRLGRLLFVDEKAPENANSTDPSVTTTLATADALPLDRTFKLHSKLGASKTIYLDFTGHVASGTAWNNAYRINTINSPAFSLDADPAFSSSELLAIQDMWRRVAEDYAFLDVDVTTEEPTAEELSRSASTDTQFGMRVVITKDFTKSTASPCGCGGFAYVGVFDQTTEAYKPAYVFHDNLANNAKYVAEAATHEAGHTLGLSHDGTATTGYYSGHGSGETGWAPIMGAGYYKNLTQWSKGQYAGANQTQDDIAIMGTKGLAVRADDYPSTLDAAAPLPKVNSANSVASYSAKGIIERATDFDVFKVNAGKGLVSINLAVAKLGPNLDAEIAVYDITSGSANAPLVTGKNDPALLGATLEINNATEFAVFAIAVRPVGKGDPLADGYTNYGSNGNYTLTVTAPEPNSTVTVTLPTYGLTQNTIAGFSSTTRKNLTTTETNYATATVQVKDNTGALAANVTVEGVFTYIKPDGSVGSTLNVKGVTTANGTVVLTSQKVSHKATTALDTFQFKLTNLTGSTGGTYNAALNTAPTQTEVRI